MQQLFKGNKDLFRRKKLEREAGVGPASDETGAQASKSMATSLGSRAGPWPQTKRTYAHANNKAHTHACMQADTSRRKQWPNEARVDERERSQKERMPLHKQCTTRGVLLAVLTSSRSPLALP